MLSSVVLQILLAAAAVRANPLFSVIAEGETAFAELVLSKGSNDVKDDFTEQWVQQRVNHFDNLDRRIFAQRYFVNETYFKAGSDGPIFLCVGGEGPSLTSKSVKNSVHCNDAVELMPKVGGLMVSIEHRYYGKSSPTKSFETEDLRYLSSKQALADLSAFHTHIVKRFRLSSKNKWVTWGGSYPGMLAAWARLKYPHQFHASIASSAPVRAEYDFQGYYNVVGQAIAEPLVGGSDECRTIISAAHAEIGELLESKDGQAELIESFHLCGGADALKEPQAQRTFAGTGVFSFDWQGNDPACEKELCNIEKICGFLRDDKRKSASHREKVTQLSLALRYPGHTIDTCQDVSPNAVTPSLMVVGVEDGSDGEQNDRMWQFQVCTEVGFFQTCEKNTDCPFTQGLHTIKTFTDQCQQLFNISPAEVRENVDLTNDFYGGDRIQGSRIMFPSGSIDPWMANSVLYTPSVREATLWVKGASHHAWTHPSKPTDSVYVKAAREAIWLKVTQWLEMDD
ncbi:hypothetical protein SARC_00562 [Sphaeroforma arctica JP610]|uniref:Thymus-specific serine protease n=1 Tax=Sphaeroforma arctica JP610 TaxID=667725 RepID=A0A0L0GE81_9EUKA|nr:hypothetical protein SARC_00562 [Sphaeroforma arctica JP610]KNC87320.1 hypothetical protein SARC_00562 [Sphaeroforma arctica JP610]|eukprot:XP_014161222.1 hypothetical protein SARC_00562 [Sphaeroforma arctica JP610]